MNWKLIFLLSLFGLAMGFATVFWIPSNIEWLFWLAIFVICAYLIAQRCTKKYFLHGFLVSLANCVWITLAHVGFYFTYVANHPEMQQMNARLPLRGHPRLLMVLMAPIIGALSGLVLGLFSFVASRLVKKTAG